MKYFIKLSLVISFSLFAMEEKKTNLHFKYPEKLVYGEFSPNKLIIFLNNEKIGEAHFMLINEADKEILYLDHIQFSSWYRNQGYGRATVEELKRFAQAHNIPEIQCRAGKRAIGFHEKCGAIKTGKQEELDLFTYKVSK